MNSEKPIPVFLHPRLRKGTSLYHYSETGSEKRGFHFPSFSIACSDRKRQHIPVLQETLSSFIVSLTIAGSSLLAYDAQMDESKHVQPKTTSPQTEPFKVISTDRCDPPEGAGDDNWYRYVIAQGNNSIVGRRQGSLSSVSAAIEEEVARLNERRMGKTGRVHLTPSPKKRG